MLYSIYFTAKYITMCITEFALANIYPTATYITMCITKFVLTPATMLALPSIITLICTLYVTRTVALATETQSQKTERRSQASETQSKTTEQLLKEVLNRLDDLNKQQSSNNSKIQVLVSSMKNQLSKKDVYRLINVSKIPNKDSNSMEPTRSKKIQNPELRGKSLPKLPQRPDKKPLKTLPGTCIKIQPSTRISTQIPNQSRAQKATEWNRESGARKPQSQRKPSTNSERNHTKKARMANEYSVTMRLSMLQRKNILRFYSQIRKGICQLLGKMNAESPQDIFITRHPTISQTFTLQLRKECYKSSIEQLQGKLMPIAGTEVRIRIIKGTYRGRKTAAKESNRKKRRTGTEKLKVIKS